MNRIILIGNGFDIAHGKKTSYENFINDFWKNKGVEVIQNQEPHECEFLKLNKPVNGKFSDLSNFSDFDRFIKKPRIEAEIKNKFFWNLCQKQSLENWVDIENEYYQRLKIISKKNDINNKDALESLNSDFSQVKKILAEYITKVDDDDGNLKQIKKLKYPINNKIYSEFSYKDFETKFMVKKIKEMRGLISDDELNERLDVTNKKPYNQNNKYLIDEYEKIKLMNVMDDEDRFEYIKPKNILLLNFNYTDTHKEYGIKDEKHGEIFEIKIHGCVHEPEKNPMIFGFGDELDKDYQSLEDLDENEYLENIKSIKYLETDNYRKLLEFAESDNFQIFIFGHSCGNSDRTLLNTLFEHENCISIKPFYHKRDDGTDNYSEIVRNISRNFTSKATMRERVVNKTYTEPLT